MSYDLVQWAYQQTPVDTTENDWKVRSQTLSWVLVTMAHLAKPHYFASMSTLSKHTRMDIKTTRRAVQRLVELGYLQEQFQKRGKTGQITEYHFKAQLVTELSTELSTKTPSSGRVTIESLPVLTPKTPSSGRAKTPCSGRQIQEEDPSRDLPRARARESVVSRQEEKSRGSIGLKSVTEQMSKLKIAASGR